MINIRPIVRRLILVVALSVLALGLLLTATAQADPIVWRPSLGTPLNLGSNATYTTTFGALGLSFPFNGKIYSNTDILSIASNGFVSLGGNNGDGSGAISGSELVNSPFPRIAALWTSLNPTVAGGNVYLNVFNDANPSLTRVSVTWVAAFNNGLTATVQMALQRNGAIVMAYNGLPQGGATGPALIGLSAGGGGTVPSGHDFSVSVPFTITSPTAYETFDLFSNPVDLDQKNLVFVPNGTTGYNVQIPQTDLEVSQVASPIPVEPNQPLTYTIAVLNAGTITATGVTITDTLPLPPLVIFKSYTTSNGGTCSLVAGSVICNLLTIPTSSPLVTVTIVVTPTRAGPITNTVSVGGNEVEYPLALWDNISSLTSPVGQADLSVSAQGAPTTVIAGNSLITYTLTLTNNGIDTATGVSLFNMLPPGVGFASASIGCSWAGTVICNLGDMSTGTTQNITVSGVVEPWARGLITNTVSVTLTDFDPNLNNNVVTTTSFANASTSLSLIKTADPSPAVAGATLTYTLNFTNAGPSAATGIALTDVVPSGVTFGGIVNGGATYSPTLNAVLWGDHAVRTAAYAWIDIKNNGTRVVWPVGDNDEGHASVALPWSFPWFGNSYSTLYIDPNGNVGFEDWPIATRTGDSRIPNPNQPNDRITAFYTDLLGPNPTWCNGQADGVFTRNDVANNRFIIQYNNWCSKRDGQLNTFEVILKPDGSVTVQYNNVPSTPPMLLSTVSPAGVESPDGSSGFVWNGTIANTAAWVYQPYFLGSQSVVYTVTVPSNAVTGSSLTNTAIVVAVEPGQTPGNNTATVTTPVTRIADISLVKTASATQLPDPGTPITYTLIATNNGPSDATTVMLTDTLPVSLTLGPITTSQGSCNGLGTIVCNLGSLPISSPSATVTIVVTPSQTIANTASASATETDPNLSNNTSTVTTTVGTADPSIGISNLPDPVIAGNVLTYTVTVTNVSGNATATGVTLSDTLPAGVTFASASIPCTVSSTLSCSLPDIATGASTAATITVNVAPAARGLIANFIGVRADQYDPDPSNNIASTTTTVNAQVDLSLTKTATSNPDLHPGMPLTYTLVITNNGPSSATGVIVTDTLPLSVTFESISAGNCSNSTNVVCTITVGTLAPNATATISLIVMPDALGPVTYVIHSTAPTATAVEPTSLTVTDAADVTVTPYTLYLPIIRNQS